MRQERAAAAAHVPAAHGGWADFRGGARAPPKSQAHFPTARSRAATPAGDAGRPRADPARSRTPAGASAASGEPPPWRQPRPPAAKPVAKQRPGRADRADYARQNVEITSLLGRLAEQRSAERSAARSRAGSSTGAPGPAPAAEPALGAADAQTEWQIAEEFDQLIQAFGAEDARARAQGAAGDALQRAIDAGDASAGQLIVVFDGSVSDARNSFGWAWIAFEPAGPMNRDLAARSRGDFSPIPLEWIWASGMGGHGANGATVISPSMAELVALTQAVNGVRELLAMSTKPWPSIRIFGDNLKAEEVAILGVGDDPNSHLDRNCPWLRELAEVAHNDFTEVRGLHIDRFPQEAEPGLVFQLGSGARGRWGMAHSVADRFAGRARRQAEAAPARAAYPLPGHESLLVEVAAALADAQPQAERWMVDGYGASASLRFYGD